VFHRNQKTVVVFHKWRMCSLEKNRERALEAINTTKSCLHFILPTMTTVTKMEETKRGKHGHV
jgi:hypothetical protein